MSRNQFRLLVVMNQLLIFGAVIVHEITEKSLPPELKNYLGIDESVLNMQITSVTPLSDVPYWFGTVLLFVGAIASVGLFWGKGWGRKLFLLNWVAMLMLTLATEVYINTGWTAFVSYLAGTTDGMILALVYFSHVKRMFENAKDV